ncbi:BnaC03g70550D [Brassica napus]|uniref:BnaC03g70550D protein n=1 Tax=Brassica napus TaxID=3708 RepID=A0A078FC98_BRANA|nr:BnaC03g70550D [Brassica napus]
MVASQRVEDDGFDCIMIPDGSFHESPKVTADEILFHDMFLTGLSLIFVGLLSAVVSETNVLPLRNPVIFDCAFTNEA